MNIIYNGESTLKAACSLDSLESNVFAILLATILEKNPVCILQRTRLFSDPWDAAE